MRVMRRLFPVLTSIHLRTQDRSKSVYIKLTLLGPWAALLSKALRLFPSVLRTGPGGSYFLLNVWAPDNGMLLRFNQVMIIGAVILVIPSSNPKTYELDHKHESFQTLAMAAILPTNMVLAL